MKARVAALLPVFVFTLIISFTIPSSANSSYSGTTTNTSANGGTSSSAQPETTATAGSTSGNSDNSWKQPASDAADSAEVAAKKAYNHLARFAKDIALEGRIKAVLHENKSTRDSDVHVTADDGVATLTGLVSSEQNAQRVQEVVAGVYGVKAVNNDLNYPHPRGFVTPPDADSTGVAHPAYSDTAPAENVSAH
jgi:hypothetical protein